MSPRAHKARLLERRFLKLYSAWQETHRSDLAEQWMTLLAKLLTVNPAYSVRHPFERAF